MNLRARLALPTLLVLLWTLVVAPFAVARCAHGDGEIHFHAIGVNCGDEAEHDSGRTDCKTVPGEKIVVGADHAKVPPVPLAPAPLPVVVVPVPVVEETARIPFSQAPPEAAPPLRPGAGFSPLLI